MAAVLVLLTVVLFIAGQALLGRLRSGAATGQAVPTAFGALHLPRGVFVDGSHTWVRLASEGELRVGLDEFLVQALGGVDRVEVVPPAAHVERGEPLATLWRRGRRVTVPSPVSGTVITVNRRALDDTRAIVADPYAGGWLAAVWPVEHGEALKPLRVGDRAVRWLEGEVRRFVEFLAHRTTPSLVGVTLPDGAHPVVGAAVLLDDEAWEEFRREFVGGPVPPVAS